MRLDSLTLRIAKYDVGSSQSAPVAEPHVVLLQD
jgi:hypothetical protein